MFDHDEESETPAGSPDEFADRVVALARDKFPLLECRRDDDFRLRLGESQLNLFNFYRSYVNAPDRFEEIMLPALTAAVQVQEWGDEQTAPPLDMIRERIMPMLYPQSAWSDSFDGFIDSTWVGGLVIAYVVDDAQTYWYVRRTLLEQWDLTDEALHELAIDNLKRYFDETPMEYMVAGEDDGRMMMPTRPDAYNAVRLLCDSFHETLRECLGQECAVGIPNRDFLIACSLDNPEMVQQIRDKVQDDAGVMDHPLCDRLLLVGPDGVSEFLEDS